MKEITKKTITFSLISQLLLFILNSAAFGDVRFVFPPGKVAVDVTSVRVVGVVDGQQQSVTLQIKSKQGSKSLEIAVNNQTFNHLIALTPGVNTIKASAGSDNTSLEILKVVDIQKKLTDIPDGYLPYYLHSKNELTGTCAGCHPLKGSVLDYKRIDSQVSCMTNKCHLFNDKEYKHGPFADKHCQECHNPHGSVNKRFLKKLREQLCFGCHTEAEGMLDDGKVIHFPVKQGECTLCHDPHQSDLAFHLKRKTILELCTGCHAKSIVNYKYMHDPVSEGDCNACHSPHVSQFKGLLYDGGKDLCLTCHEVRKEEFESKYVHEPVTKDCSLCHDPHGSNAEFHLRGTKDKNGHYIEVDQPIKELCLKCHRKLDPEVARQIEHSKVPHKPVAEGKCTVCHTPHSTNFKKQLKAPMKEICFSCHPKIKRTITESLYKHGPVRTNDCAQCHLVHGSDHKKLLRANFTSKYSGKFNLKKFELCLGCHNQKVFTDQQSKDTGFRNGTTNLHFMHVNRKKKGRTCKTCHDIHASNQEKHIRSSIPYKKKFKITMEFTKTATGGGCVVGCHKPKKYDRESPVSY